MPNELDEYFDQYAPTSRDKLAAKQAEQQAEADREGVPLETIRFREREAAKMAEQRAEQHRNAAAAAAMANAQAALPSLEGFPPLARQAMQRELLRREMDRQRQEAEELARDPERAQRVAVERRLAWEDAWKREHGVWPSFQEMADANIMDPKMLHWWNTEAVR